MLLGITDKVTGEGTTSAAASRAPQARTSLAMTFGSGRPGRPLYLVEFYGDDIAWPGVQPRRQARVYRMSPGSGLQCRQDTNEKRTGRPGLHPARQRRDLHQRRPTRPAPTGLVGGRDAGAPRRTPPAGSTGRGSGSPTATPDDAGTPWRTRTADSRPALANVPNVAAGLQRPQPGADRSRSSVGAPATEPGGSARSPTSRGRVHDGLTLGAEATFAAEGVEGVSRYMTRRPCGPSWRTARGAYAQYWL